MNIAAIEKCITQPGIKIVSFDIFDTLLERPALEPSDIFILLNQPVKELLNNKHFNFHKARKAIEHEAVHHQKNSNQPAYTLSLEQIYEYFQTKYHISPAQTLQIMTWEKNLERQVLAPRKTGRKLFAHARAAGKRIICISDMYHDKNFLVELLTRNGFHGIDEIYVSSQIKKRKDHAGELFSHVLKKEGLSPEQLLHIGDRADSDYSIPLKLGIPAFLIPSSTDDFFKRTAGYNIWKKQYTPAERLVIGFAIKQWAQIQGNTDALFPSKKDIGYFGIGPVLFGIAQHIKTSQSIQKRYSCIHFASRDGYLPMMAYNFLAQESAEKGIPARYLYSGRMLYHAANYKNNPVRYLTRHAVRTWSSPDMTLGQLCDALLSPFFLDAEDPRRAKLLSKEINERFPALRAIMRERANHADQLLHEKNQRLREYYGSVISLARKQRALVFDCGCGGSVSTNIMRVAGGKVDKVYLCDTARNRLLDLTHRTRTHLLLGNVHDLDPAGALNVFEEVFSSTDGPCIDLVQKDKTWQPVFDETKAPGKHTISDVLLLQTAALDFVKEIKARFGTFLDHLEMDSTAFAAEPLLAALRFPSDTSIRHFERIVFPDAFYGDNRPLNIKIEPNQRDHLLRTPFVDKTLTVSRPHIPANTSPMRVALHLHLFHIDMAPCFVDRLSEWQTPLDLYISVCSQKDEKIARILFSPLLANPIRQIVIRTFPNRGRDTASWITGFGEELATYDLAGHVHTKKSPHFDWGDQWRDYLYDNLISWNAFRDIQALFQSNTKLGLVFPPVYQELFRFWGNKNLTHLEPVDVRNCQALLQRMGLDDRINKHNLHFPVGTMFWYRPAALAPMTDMKLTFDDFEAEPIGITGSRAHAIERLPALVASHCGFSACAYIRQDHLIDQFHQDRLQSIGATRSANMATSAREKRLSTISHLLLPLFPRGTRRHQLAQAIARIILRRGFRL
jgi:FMN phosphatase YigB (HAD superfamily)